MTAELISAIQAERDLLVTDAEVDTYRIDVILAEAASALQSLQEENERLKTALRPFAKEDLHRARSALSPKQGTPE